MYDMSTVFAESGEEGVEGPWVPGYPATDPGFQALGHYPRPAYAPYAPDPSLNSYTQGAYDIPDVNSLEPSLFSYPPIPPHHHHNSPTGSSSHTSASDDAEETWTWPGPPTPLSHHPHHPYRKTEAKTKQPPAKTKKRKPKRDPNEPQKPVSAYALFFRDTQAAIKGQNPNASFGEVSKIVASMWDTLDAEAKNAYKQKTETAKKDYLKQLAAYRANLVSRGGGARDDPHMVASSPDSTTPCPSLHHSEPETCGDRSLASLIAQPPARHVLTATTTLTVPAAYVPSSRPPLTQPAQPPQHPPPSSWSDFAPSQGLLHHCRDVFSIWGPAGPTAPPPSTLPAPPEYAQ